MCSTHLILWIYLNILWQRYSYSAIFAQFIPDEYIRIFICCILRKWIYTDIHSPILCLTNLFGCSFVGRKNIRYTLAKPFIANSQVKQKWKYKYLYTWHIANVTRSPKYWSWRRYFLTYYLLTKLKVELGCRHTEHPQLMQEHPEIFYTGALMLSTINYMYLCGPTKSVTWSNGQWKIYTKFKEGSNIWAFACKINILKSQNQTICLHLSGVPQILFLCV